MSLLLNKQELDEIEKRVFNVIKQEFKVGNPLKKEVVNDGEGELAFLYWFSEKLTGETDIKHLPGLFIEYMDDNGKITSIDVWVLDQERFLHTSSPSS